MANHWLFVGLIAVLAYPIYYNYHLSGLGREIVPLGTDRCIKITEPSLGFCEDVIDVSDGVAYTGCDPARDKKNKVVGYDYFEPGEAVPSGQLWRIDYNKESVQAKPIAMQGAPEDFHPLGFRVDAIGGFVLAINLRLAPGAGNTIEVFTLKEEAGETVLVYKRTIEHADIYNPNSLNLVQSAAYRAADGMPSFFVSNDHYSVNRNLKLFENFLMLPLANVMFYDARHSTVSRVAQGLSFANGLAGDDSVLFVCETNKLQVKQYTVDLSGGDVPKLTLVQTVFVDMAVDNAHWDEKTQTVIAAGHPKGLDFIAYSMAKNRSDPAVPRASSLVVSWNINDKVVKPLFADNGHFYGASSAAFEHGGKLLVSSLYDEGVLVCKAQ
ncbi:hypothetical protein BC940DRAFT_305707 [Gongronella butleri]|nr:hypothetical protein BC940DRAFT_305707 [Gongronella butleri]